MEKRTSEYESPLANRRELTGENGCTTVRRVDLEFAGLRWTLGLQQAGREGSDRPDPYRPASGRLPLAREVPESEDHSPLMELLRSAPRNRCFPARP